MEHRIAILANAMSTGQIDIEPRFITDAAFDHVIQTFKERDFIIVYDEGFVGCVDRCELGRHLCLELVILVGIDDNGLYEFHNGKWIEQLNRLGHFKFGLAHCHGIIASEFFMIT